MLNWIAWNRTIFLHWNRVLMLNWTLWNRTAFDFEFACKQKTILILNWIVWNRTVYMYENGFGINDLQWLMCHKTKPNQNCNLSCIKAVFFTFIGNIMIYYWQTTPLFFLRMIIKNEIIHVFFILLSSRKMLISLKSYEPP